MGLRPIYYDTETTGISPEKDRIVEIAAYDAFHDKSFCMFVNPKMRIPPDAIKIHGITDEMVEHAPSFLEVGKQFFEFCGEDAVLIAHNNDAFDKHFLRLESERNGLTLPELPMVDSLKWARKYRPDLPRHSLQFLRQIYGVKKNNAHRALDDVLVLHQVFSAMIDDLPLETVMQLLQEEENLQLMPFGKHQGKKLEDVPADYILWLKGQGVFEKPENQPLKKALEKMGHFSMAGKS